MATDDETVRLLEESSFTSQEKLDAALTASKESHRYTMSVLPLTDRQKKHCEDGSKMAQELIEVWSKYKDLPSGAHIYGLMQFIGFIPGAALQSEHIAMMLAALERIQQNVVGFMTSMALAESIKDVINPEQKGKPN